MNASRPIIWSLPLERLSRRQRRWLFAPLAIHGPLLGYGRDRQEQRLRPQQWSILGDRLDHHAAAVGQPAPRLRSEGVGGGGGLISIPSRGCRRLDGTPRGGLDSGPSSIGPSAWIACSGRLCIPRRSRYLGAWRRCYVAPATECRNSPRLITLAVKLGSFRVAAIKIVDRFAAFRSKSVDIACEALPDRCRTRQIAGAITKVVGDAVCP